jgi:hypothetical protein
MSTDHQQFSLDNQSDAIQRYADQHNMTVVRTYSDAAKSGLTLCQRPGLRQLLEDVERGAAGYSAVLVYDVSDGVDFKTQMRAHFTSTVVAEQKSLCTIAPRHSRTTEASRRR